MIESSNTFEESVNASDYPFDDHIGEQYEAYFWSGGVKAVFFEKSGYRDGLVKGVFNVIKGEKYQIEIVIEKMDEQAIFDLNIESVSINKGIDVQNYAGDLKLTVRPFIATDNLLDVEWKYADPDTSKILMMKYVAVRRMANPELRSYSN